MKKKHNKITGDAEKQGKSKTQSRKQIEQAVRNLAEPGIISLGYELWNIEYYHDGIEWLLEISIDKPGGGISLDDCEKVTHTVNPVIDAADPIENSYSLAVSSPGLNRELKNAFHLNKYIEKEVTVKLFAKNELAGDKAFNAILKGFDGENYAFVKIPESVTINLAKKEVAHVYAYDEINIKNKI